MKKKKKMEAKKINMIGEIDWSNFVQETYGRTYRFQQQDGCKERGVFNLTVPSEAEDFESDTVPEIVNHYEMGVTFKAWLERDPKTPLNSGDEDMRNNPTYINMWWERNFYPNIQMVANDLHSKGLLDAGEYVIDIDW